MRYTFDNQARSIFNRVHSCLNGLDLVEYGKLPLGDNTVVALWAIADHNTDWNGEEENAWELFPGLKTAWETTIKFDLNQTPEQAAAEDAYYAALHIVVLFENLMWLAICVSNAINGLEGSPLNHWSREDREDILNVEFSKERHMNNARASEIMLADQTLRAALLPTG